MLLRRFARPLRAHELTVLVCNVVVGAGVIALPGRVYATAGGYGYAALALAVTIAVIIGCTFAVLARLYPVSGGPYAYASLTLGRDVGVITGCLLLGTRLLSAAVSMRILAELSEALYSGASVYRSLVTALLCLSMAILALVGVTAPVRVSNVIAVIKFAVLGAVAYGGLRLFTFASGQHDVQQGSVAGLGPATLIWFYAFTGFEAPTILAANAARPQRDLPVAVIFGILFAGLLYVTLFVACLSWVPHLAKDPQPVATLAAEIFPASHLVFQVALILVAAASLPSQFSIAPRLLASMAEKGDAPSAFLPNRAGLSRSAVALYSAAAFGLSSIDLTPLIAGSTAIRLMSYSVCALGLMRTEYAGRRYLTLALGSAAFLASIVLILAGALGAMI